MKKLLFLVLLPGFVLGATADPGEPTSASRLVESATEKLMEYAHPDPFRRWPERTLPFLNEQLQAGGDPECISIQAYRGAKYSAYTRAMQDYDLGALVLLLAYGCNPNIVRNLRAPSWDGHSPVSGILLGEDRNVGKSLPMVELLMIFGFDPEKRYYSTALQDIVQQRVYVSAKDILSRKKAVQTLLDHGAYQGFDEAQAIVKRQKDSSEEAFKALHPPMVLDNLEGLGGIKDAWVSMAGVFEGYRSEEKRAEVKAKIESHKTKSMHDFLDQWARERILLDPRASTAYGRLLEVLSYPAVVAKLASFHPYEVKKAE